MKINLSSPRHILHLWFAKVSDATRNIEQTTKSLLSASEMKRLGSIANNNKHREYLLSRALMRHALSEKFPQQKDSWIFTERVDSPPIIKNIPEKCFTSLSHSDGIICFAISGSTIGIDLEVITKQRDYPKLAQLFMDDSELECFLRDESTQADHFYRIWCAKEAYYKTIPCFRQSATTLNRISFSDLIAGDDSWHLIEATTHQYVFAAMMRNKPEEIKCNYSLSAEKCLMPVDRFEIH